MEELNIKDYNLIKVDDLALYALEEVTEYRDYQQNSLRLTEPQDHSVYIDAKRASHALFLIKMLLCNAKLLITVACPWCIVDKEKHALAKMEAHVHHRYVRFQGFHCEEHAERMHAFFKLDASMHYSCCE